MVALLEKLINLRIWEYQRIQEIEKWWLLRPSNLLWRRWGSMICLFSSHYYCGAMTGWIFLAVVHTILLHGRWSRMKDLPHVGETKLNCFWHCYQSFRICLYVRIIFQHNEIVLWCYEGFNFGSRRKKCFNLGFLCPLASRLFRYNIPSNTNETTMAANASQWFADQR